MRIHSWNIAQSLDKPSALINEWDTDIYCLLECDSKQELIKLANDKHYRYIDDSYNMALVSKFTISAFKDIRHSAMSKAILTCNIDIHGTTISIYLVHLMMPLNSKEKHTAQLK